MKAIWLFMFYFVQLSRASSYCPKKCFCLWYTDYSLKINCSGSEQKEVPFGINSEVKFLDLSFNEIEFYNHSKYLSTLEEIDISNNKISEASFGGSSSNIYFINLSHNYISSLKKVNIEELSNLKKLDLSYNTELKELSGLKSESLEVLDLSNCLIPYVEEGFLDELNNIRSIDLSFNSFHFLTNIRSDSLELIDVSHSEIEYLTQYDIFNLPTLKKLNTSYNSNLKINFSYENSCWNVENLDVSNSGMDSLEDMFPFCSLQVLNASVNKIKVIEVRTFFNNCELVFVNLSNNKISEIHDQAFYTNGNLKVLDLSVNQIQKVSFTSNLKKLIHLDLSRNQISSVKDIVLKNVVNLNLSYNKIKAVKVNLNENAPKLKKLNLSFNKVQNIDRINSRTVSVIDLSHCEIDSISVDAFEGAENLVKVKLTGNRLKILNYQVFKDLNYLEELSLNQNPWVCSCQSQEFIDLYEFLNKETSYIKPQDLKCHGSNNSWKNACFKKWKEEKEWKKTTYSLAVSLAIGLIVVAIIFFCKYLNKKQIERRQREVPEEIESRTTDPLTFRNSIENIPQTEEVPHYVRSSTPPPNYEAALLLPKLTIEQKQLAASTLTMTTPNEAQGINSQTEESNNENNE